jgi:endonuclease YncB( thermonuclease family)
VRLIEADTPETKDPRKPVQYFGKEATAFTQRAVPGKGAGCDRGTIESVG